MGCEGNSYMKDEATANTEVTFQLFVEHLW